jgi:hypothetical protein
VTDGGPVAVARPKEPAVAGQGKPAVN